MYQVAKISVTSLRRSYDYKLDYRTWAQMISDMARRMQYANEVFCGRGSAILQDGEVIGHTETLYHLSRDVPISKITRAMFLEESECGL